MKNVMKGYQCQTEYLQTDLSSEAKGMYEGQSLRLWQNKKKKSCKQMHTFKLEYISTITIGWRVEKLKITHK